jgi:hypothetical protein
MNHRAKNYLRGRISKTEGMWFENFIHRQAVVSGWVVFHIPQGCKIIGAGKIVMVETPFDFVFVKNGHAVFADAKSFDDTRISKSKLKAHQVDAMAKAAAAGCRAGYIVFFRPIQEYRFFDAKQLLALRPGTSYAAADGILLGQGEDFDLEKVLVRNTDGVQKNEKA